MTKYICLKGFCLKICRYLRYDYVFFFFIHFILFFLFSSLSNLMIRKKGDEDENKEEDEKKKCNNNNPKTCEMRRRDVSLFKEDKIRSPVNEMFL